MNTCRLIQLDCGDLFPQKSGSPDFTQCSSALEKLLNYTNLAIKTLKQSLDFSIQSTDFDKPQGQEHLCRLSEKAILKPVVHFLGDSMLRNLLELIESIPGDRNWVGVSQEKNHFFPGYSLAKFHQQLTRSDSYETGTEIVFLNIGTNTASTRDCEYPIAAICSEFDGILDEILRIYPNVKKVIVSELLKRWDALGEKRATVMNDVFEIIVRKRGPVFEFVRFKDKIEDRRFFVNSTKKSDYVHLNDDGKKEYAGLINIKITKYFSKLLLENVESQETNGKPLSEFDAMLTARIVLDFYRQFKNQLFMFCDNLVSRESLLRQFCDSITLLGYILFHHPKLQKYVMKAETLSFNTSNKYSKGKDNSLKNSPRSPQPLKAVKIGPELLKLPEYQVFPWLSQTEYSPGQKFDKVDYRYNCIAELLKTVHEKPDWSI